MRGLAALSAWLLAGPALAQMPLPPVAPVGTAATAPEWHDAFRHAVAACWNTGALSPEAQAARVIVAVRFDAHAMPEPDSIALVTTEGAGTKAGQQAYDAARRALLRCAAGGYPLPPAARADWQRMELVFDAGVLR